MTSNKREDIGTAEGEPEPKVPRNEEGAAGEEAKQEEKDANDNTNEDDAVLLAGDGAGAETGESSDPPKKGDKAQGYMSFTGHRHPRVGDDFQVASLPSPSDAKEDENGESSDAKFKE
jgi:hypothetical protein